MMRIHFRTRGGPVQGWGNVHRLAAFAAMCRERLAAEILFFAEGPNAVADFLRQRDFEVEALADDIDLAAEEQRIARYPAGDVAIMEMLECTYARQRMLKRHARRLVVFDDLLDHRYGADVVVCGQPLPAYANRAISDSGTAFYCGLDYFILRPEFARAAKPRDPVRTVRRVLIALGGGRYEVAHLKVAHALAALTEEPGANFEAVFILGHAAHTDLVEAIGAVLPRAVVLGGVDDMVAAYESADLALVSAGYSKFEAAATGTPAIMIATQWHQIPLAETAAPILGIPNLGYMSFVDVDTVAAAIRRLLPYEARARQSTQAHAAMPRDGMDRVFRLLFEECR